MVRFKALRKEKGLVQEKVDRLLRAGRSTVAMQETEIMPNGEVVREEGPEAAWDKGRLKGANNEWQPVKNAASRGLH